MRTRLHLKPGQKGTKQLPAQYGDRLVCMRYRYDAQRKKRVKTVELIVAECAWEPPAPRFADDVIVAVRVGLSEREMQQRVKQATGKWNRRRQVWELRYDQVVGLTLQARIVAEHASNHSYHG
ncbi:MAG: hypothetical protein HYZ81_08290 [Nitrospinae bacterium]|nr:hypothetical protein [Nitrospinota bacterium]